MSADKIAKLQGLLARVQRNAALPRPARVQAADAKVVVSEDIVDEEEVTIEEAVVEPVAAQVAVEPAPIPAAPVEADGEAPEIEMSAESIEDLELLDSDVVDITDEPPPVAIEEEEPPASSRRPKAAASMSEALAGAAEQLDSEGREIPLKTPPPESGPQEAPPVQGLGAPPVPEGLAGDGVDDLLAADPGKLEVPTPEQLGATVDLEEASGVIEIADDRPPPAPPAPIEPEVTARPPVAPDAAPAAFSSRSEPKIESFLDLLDASLGL